MSRQTAYFVLVLGVAIGARQAQGQTSSCGSEHCLRPAARHGGGCGASRGPYASTAAEGYLRGMAAVIRAQGEYNLATSTAMANLAVAEKQRIANHRDRIEAYFAGRQMNMAAKAIERAQRSPGQRAQAKLAQAANGRRAAESLFDPATGKIVWPALLQGEKYESFRSEMERLVAKRKLGREFGPAHKGQVAEMASAMLTELKDHIREYGTGEYLAARRFLSQLATDA